MSKPHIFLTIFFGQLNLINVIEFSETLKVQERIIFQLKFK